MRTLSKILLPLCLLLIFVTAAAAQPVVNAQSIQDFKNSALSGHGTPDGVPPSGETICAGQTGAAHGLCTAYCEAMDCDSAAPQASAKACAKVHDNFMQHTGQAPPCDCPCVTQVPGWIEQVNGPVQGCVANQTPDPTADFAFLITPNSLPVALFSPGSGVCGFLPFFGIPISEQQGRACVNLLRQRAAAAGVTCTDI